MPAVTKQEYVSHLEALAGAFLHLANEVKKSDHNGWLDSPPPVGTRMISLPEPTSPFLLLSIYPRGKESIIQEILPWGFVVKNYAGAYDALSTEDWKWFRECVQSPVSQDAACFSAYEALPKDVKKYLDQFEITP